MTPYKVKVSHPYSDLSTYRQSPGGKSIWGNYEFIFDYENKLTEADYWIVLNDIPTNQTTKVPKGNTVLWTGEPYLVHRYPDAFVKQFGKVITCQPEITTDSVFHSQPAIPWFVHRSYDELKAMDSVPKSRKISMIVSNKQFTEGHKKRYDFAMKLKEHFGDQIDFFGRGINDFDDKWDVLADYEFSIAIENSQSADYFTEKIMDCYLSLTVPIYYGCPNINDYFSSSSMQLIDLDDFDGSIERIKALLDDKDYYAKHVDALRIEKQKCLDEYNIFPVLANVLNTLPASSKKQKIHLYTEAMSVLKAEQATGKQAARLWQQFKVKAKRLVKRLLA